MLAANLIAPGPQFAAAALNQRAKGGSLDLGALITAAEGLKSAGQARQAADLYKTWIAFNPEQRQIHFAYFNLSVCLRELGDSAGALNALRECLRIDPTFAHARINLGRTLEDNGLTQPAIDQWRRLVDEMESVTPERIGHKLMALQHIGRVFEGAELFARAEDALKQAVELRPDRTEAAQHWISLRQRQCKWPVLARLEHAPQQQLLNAMSPMSLNAYADDPMFQLAKAHHYFKALVGRVETVPRAPFAGPGRGRAPRRLRVGYVSSDLREHAVGFALSEVLELHDKEKFEIFAYASGEPRPHDRTQGRIRAAVDHWRDIADLSDLDAAGAIAADRVDVLVDLNGYTKHARTKIFAHRPAPVIVNWCGYPGTMGSPHHHYIIADKRIIPPENEIYYSEKVLRIPCNQPVDRKRAIGAEVPTRGEAGLPENAFVFCSFNGAQKVTENCFDRWMAILSQTGSSVLWLLTGGDDTDARLRALAERRGIAPDRILFAPKAPNAKHLARIPLADLFLDTSPYGAHSTAADALTMGLPILTLAGRSFASRFCASVVGAAGLEDLVCRTSDEYVRRAVELAHDPKQLRAHRERLAAGRDASTLRDIPALVRRLERLFEEMRRDLERDAVPTPNLTNLDVYYEIGCALDLPNVERLTDRAYRALYVDQLAKRHEISPLPPDERFWPAEPAGRARAPLAASA